MIATSSTYYYVWLLLWLEKENKSQKMSLPLTSVLIFIGEILPKGEIQLKI